MTDRDGDGFEAMYRRDVQVLMALALSLTGSREQGADLVQEAMARALRAWDTVGRLERPGAWTRRVLINLTIDAHRRDERERRAVQRIRLADAEVEPVNADSDPFWTAVRALPERQRAAIALYYIEDLSIAEIAHMLEISPGTVKASLHSGRRTLARVLGAEGVAR